MSTSNSCLLTQKGPFSVKLVFKDREGSFQLVQNSEEGLSQVLYEEPGFVADIPPYSDIPEAITSQWMDLIKTNALLT